MPPFEQVINRNLIVDKVAELLYQLRIVPEGTIITNIQFSDLFGMSVDEFTKMKVFTRKEGVKRISHNGT